MLSSRALCPGSIVPLTAALVDGWIPGTSPGMTADGRHTIPDRSEFRDLSRESARDAGAGGGLPGAGGARARHVQPEAPHVPEARPAHAPPAPCPPPRPRLAVPGDLHARRAQHAR